MEEKKQSMMRRVCSCLCQSKKEKEAEEMEQTKSKFLSMTEEEKRVHIARLWSKARKHCQKL